MSSYYRPHDSGMLSKRAIVFVAIVAFHVVIIYAFMTGLATQGARLVQTILQTNIIQTDKPKELPPPPPNVKLNVPPPVSVVAPEVTINIPTAPPPIAYVAPKAPVKTAPIHVAVVPIVGPKATYAPDPQDFYPDQSRRNNEEGRAMVHICIDVRGRVASAEVQATSGHPLLDQAAARLAKAYRFKPATQAGKPVNYCTGLPVKFVLTSGLGQ